MNDLEKQIWNTIKNIPDPEIPVITIEELGVLRKVEQDASGKIIIYITPTYSGCPAMQRFEDDIMQALAEKKLDKNVAIKTIYEPAWTTDWMTDQAKQKLEAYGIAPPAQKSYDKAAILGKQPVVKCPRCKSTNTTLISQFGSTACKALYKCNDCLEPFEYFKCL
jgi:ring-1,2-phenylacetyl-CoA epoxidase subunit PaaD